ncbi:MAG: ThiF family adenylyltransferase [Smithellaceae bacterium]|jgi:molybdopterin/thiamine biosynthesis adenylyltransferase|nr:ThiF family adenylyltransferase [Smithellaceae bacterium]MDD3260108.1 ThiF family adenylyltransferase [Smithellaceae bacterium]MDD3848915.1 ThiF family adenylyltransferase [Smithellaceae bacterium]HOG13165.1 ThiF family adenylyltransferase [Smithellaceae bacterium]HOQ72538.1 ThiF family adenylyltransferase [Smithellaceae bacterium]
MKTDDALGYTDLFRRNYGILSTAQQERIRKARILIVGDSGVGETLAVLLSRSGCEHFVLIGRDAYEPADMNRQPCCGADTIGRSKVPVIAEVLKSINSEITVDVFRTLPPPEALDGWMSRADIVIPAVDDLAYSVLLFRAARKNGKTAVLCMSSGAMGWVSVFTPESSTLEDCLGIPDLDYEGLTDVVRTQEFKCAQYHYVTAGGWRVDWYREYFRGERPLAQLCAVAWLAASLAALEILKVVSGKWPFVCAPRCWSIHKAEVSLARFSRLVKYHRKLGWLIFGGRRGRPLHRWTGLFWSRFFRYWQERQRRAD